MIKLEKADVFGWESAIRGMRNPLNSWDKSDSVMSAAAIVEGWEWIGPNDLSLMKKLIKAGSDHSKFMRMVNVTADITAPLYWWKEYDTYKVGTVANSCSTMHKIHAKELTLDDFSHEHLIFTGLSRLQRTIDDLNDYREIFLEWDKQDETIKAAFGNDKKKVWWQMIQLLPSSYNQKRTVQLNYAVLRNMYHSRKNHKLDEWRAFCEWVETLPYAELITE